MTNKNGKLIYWDSCVFLSYINGIPNRLRTINDILEEVTKDADGKILTSSESIVEVAHALYEKENKQLDPIVEEAIDAMWDDSSVINMIDNGPHISKIARKLIRDAIPSNWVLKSKDAVHLASAMWYDKNICSIAELHTYDEGLFKYQAMIGIPVVLPHTDQLRLHFTDDK